MKSKELIKQLKEADPSGECEVTIGKTPIWHVEKLPAYYDGCLKLLITDEKKRPFYDIIGMKVTDKGEHIDLVTVAMKRAILDNPDIPIELDLESDFRINHYTKMINELRKDARDFHEALEEDDIE